MNNKIILLSAMLFSAVASAQVKIGGTDGTPNANAMLEVEATNKGMLLPRVALVATNNAAPLSAHVRGIIVYNTTVNAVNGLELGLYQNDGTQWKRLIAQGDQALGGVKFFYMPSIVFNTSAAATGLKRNLYAEYKAQFTGKTFVMDANGGTVTATASTKFVKSTGAPAEIPNIPAATDLYYYVTDYDGTALANLTIDANGILTYDVIGTGTDYSFVNIVFVVK